MPKGAAADVKFTFQLVNSRRDILEIHPDHFIAAPFNKVKGL
jgi:hypothetical protein